jgi:GWxTD domain-containing protein
LAVIGSVTLHVLRGVVRALATGSARATLLVLPIALPEPADAQLEVTMYRSWTPPNATVVHGLFRVDGTMLGTGAECTYRVRLSVTDSAGTPLVNNEWEGRCPAPRDGTPAGALETFQFAVVPARYTVLVTVTPQNGGTPVSATVPLESLPADALSSDLILARAAGWADSATTVQYTIRRGQLGLAAASEIVADEQRPQIAYYLEIYPTADAPMTGKLIGIVRRPDGKQLVQIPLQNLQAVTASKPLVANVPLDGLAPGDYVFETRLELSDTTIVRSHPFRMEGMLSQQAQPAPAAQPGTGYFWTLTPEQLRELFDPVIVTLQRQADRELFQNLNPDGKRRFLQQYFGGVEPTEGGDGDNPLDQYLKRVHHVQREYVERQGGLEGWRTDRGRIYLKRGDPNNRVSRPLPPAGAAPYEIWQHTVPSNYVYVFVDEARIGSYRLVYTNDPLETSLPDWERRISSDAAEELMRMGIPVRIRNQ